MNLLRAAAVSTAIVSSNAFAIFGIGGHWAPNMGASTKSLSEEVGSLTVGSETQSINFERGAVDGMQGFGLKLWIDALPFVDLEATGNIQFGTYTADITYPVLDESNNIVTGKQKLIPDLDVMGVKLEGKPFISQFMGDLTVQYPIADVIPMVKPYVGAGVTYFYGTPLIDKDLAKGVADKMVEAAQSSGGEAPSEDQAIQIVKDALGDMEIKQTVGGHVMAGLKLEPVLIPFAIYANGKYYFGGIEDVTNGVVLEVGGALAF